MANPLMAVSYPRKNSLNNVSSLPYDFQRVARVLLERDCSKHTLIALASDIRHFLEFYSKQNGEVFSFKRAVARDVISFRDGMKVVGLKPGSINRRLVNVRLFFRQAQRMGIIQQNPAEGVRQLQMQPLAPKSLTPFEARRLLREVEIRGNQRDLLVVNLMLLAGLRASEVIGLTVEDVELSERKGTLHIRNAKGNKNRDVPANAQLRECLTKYVERYKPQGQLIVGQRGPIVQLALNQIVGKYANKAGVKCTPHQLRHSFATAYMLCNPGDIVGLSQTLGHSSTQTSARYCMNRLADLQERVEAVNF
ncbi:MAG: tyrosine-type recombinase/integrase [Candidatus Peribacteraceae bacterium]|nr:tyrosine-type recombinase/integrase [Candidatus Peribacteraceae bacterium]MDD5739258.1 tyrosine-type recombinase/integrase [Candidatus Peribacteraceae bacterium]